MCAQPVGLVCSGDTAQSNQIYKIKKIGPHVIIVPVGNWLGDDCDGGDGELGDGDGGDDGDGGLCGDGGLGDGLIGLGGGEGGEGEGTFWPPKYAPVKLELWLGFEQVFTYNLDSIH